MIKKNLLNLVDAQVFLYLITVVVLSSVITLVISDKVKDFATEYKKKFYGYILLVVLIYAIAPYLGHSIKFEELRNQLFFYQIISLVLGILHVWIYRTYFKEFNVKKIYIEVLFALIAPLYSSVLFVIFFSIFNGLNFTFLMCGHFMFFIVPTLLYLTFCLMMLIPPKVISTWNSEESYKNIDSNEMKNMLLITLLIKKEYDDNEYITIRAQTPAKVDFGRLFFLATKGYNRQNLNNSIQLKMADRQNWNWIFYLKPKWYQPIRYVNALRDMESNRITENSIIICERVEKKQAASEEKKKPDKRVYGSDSNRDDEQQDKIDELKEDIEEGPIN